MGKDAFRAACAVSGALVLLAGEPAGAAMGCWNAQRTAAAKVKDLQSRLMVAALRCRTTRTDALAAYNDFVSQNRATLQAENGLVHAQFETGYGKDADTYYDRFATSLANRYGGDATSSELCDEAVATIREAAAATGDVGRLVAIADRFGPTPELPGGACALAFAVASAPEQYPTQPATRAYAVASPAPEPHATPPALEGHMMQPQPVPTFADAMDRALADVSDPPRAPARPHTRSQH